MEETGQCVRCLQPVPSKAARCPQCGQPTTNNPRRLIFIGAAAAGVLALLFILVVMYRAVYLSDLEQAPPLEDEQAAPAPFDSATPTSQDKPPAPKDEKPSQPAKPEKQPPLNR